MTSFKGFFKDKRTKIYEGLVKTDQGNFEYNIFNTLLENSCDEFTLHDGNIEIKAAILHSYNDELYLTYISDEHTQKNDIFKQMDEAESFQDLCNITNHYIEIYPECIMSSFIEAVHKFLVNKKV